MSDVVDGKYPPVLFISSCLNNEYHLVKFYFAIPLISVVKWKTFFENAKLPDEYVSLYAEKFSDQPMTENTLHDLTDDELKELGVHKMGHRMLILTHINNVMVSLSSTNAT